MKITDLRTTFLTIPFVKPEVWAWGKRPGLSAMLVEVLTDDTVVGLGESVCTHTSMDVMKGIVESAKKFILHRDPFNIEKIVRDFYSLGGWHFHKHTANHVLAGVEMALWDVIGKACGKPLCQIWGGTLRDAVPFTVYIIRDKPETMIMEAQRYLEMGYRTFDVKVGIDPDEDLAIVKSIRDTVGDDVSLRVDANQMWSPGTAVRNIRKLEKLDLEYVEQPVIASNLDAMAMLRRRTGVPIASDESSSTLDDVHNVIKREAADVILIDARKLGGLWACKKAAAVAEAAGIPVVMHTSGEAGIATAAFSHVIASTPNFNFANQTLYQYLTDDIVAEKFELEQGRLRLPTGPGLGVRLDDAKVSKYSELYTSRGALTHFEPLESKKVPVPGSM